MVEWALQKTYEYAKLMSYYKCAMMEIETEFNVLNEEFSLQFDRQPINSIKTRLKNPISIRQKLSVKGYELSLESIEQNLHDVAGIRVVWLISQSSFKKSGVQFKHRKGKRCSQ